MKKAFVISNRFLKKEYFLLWINEPYVAKNARPGQFVMIKAWPGCDPLLARPFSIHDVDNEKFAVLYQVKGRGTKLLSQLKKGHLLNVLGPLGCGFPDLPPKIIYMVAGGIGIAPFLFTAKYLLNKGHKIKLFYGARTTSDLIQVRAFQKLGIRVILTTEDGSSGYRGLITEPLEKALVMEKAIVFACGPMPMLKAVADIAKRQEVKAYLSLEARMACGLGLCLGCVVPRQNGGFLHVCIDGPVVEAEKIF